MSDFDVFDDSDHLPSDQLINELESIKGLLHSNGDDNDDSDTTVPPVDIPLLDDMVIGHLNDNARLLNLNRIFEEESEEPTTPRVRPDYSRDVLIQELVDEFVPQIEAALRERLSQLDNAALQQWKDRD